MKKPLIFSIVLGSTLLFSSAATLAIGSTAPTSSSSNQPAQLAINTELGNTSTRIRSDNETIYSITDTAGLSAKTFIGNTIDDSGNPLPVELKISYYLDGAEISATELAGKSGHVKITYQFSATESYQGKLIPFLTVTDISLDSTKFDNIKIDNGKIVSDSSNTMLIGYTFAGLGQDFGTDILPDSFTIQADTTNFELKNTYTFATNELFAELDTSKLTSVDSIIGSINDLSAGLDKIISGSTDLSNGIDSLAVGISKLQLGANNLATGTTNLAAGASKLSDGLNSLVAFDNEILSKANATVSEVTTKAQELIEKYHVDPVVVAELTQPVTEYYNKIYTAVTSYTGNIESLAAGANNLSAGINSLAAGASELKSGMDSLAAGASELSAGSHTLNQGLSTFKTSGIDQLTNFANHDIATFTYNFRQTVAAAKSHTTHTKIIFKTPSIK